MVDAKVIKKNLFTAKAFALLLGASVLLNACSSGNRLDVDVDNIEVKLNIKRFDEDIFALKGIDKASETGALKKKYGTFYYDYIGRIMQWGNPDSAQSAEFLYRYINSQPAQRLFRVSEGIYRDFTPYEAELTQAFKYFKYYFPKEPIPDIVTFQSQFSDYLNPAGQGYLGIALDMHLGDTFKPYQYVQPEIPRFRFKILTPRHVAAHIIISHVNSMYEDQQKIASFADKMVYLGKLQYVLDACLPETPDYIRLGYTPEEYKWCTENEKMIWEYFVKEKVLYNPNAMDYERFFKEGPHTMASGVPAESAPMIGTFAGRQLVHKYMDIHPDITLQQLMADTDATKIIRDSKYKP